MTPLRLRLIEDLQLRGFSPRTQEAYVHAVHRLAQHFHKSPDLITPVGESVRQFSDADITSQQLIDGSVVLVNGNRVQVPLARQ
jgi:Phage integrase, N-terminal SAM-like domain